MKDVKWVLQQIDEQYELLTDPQMEQFFKDLQKRQIEEEGKNNAIYATVTNELGAYYRVRSRYSESEACFSESAEILKNIYGEKSVEYATVLNNIAEVYRLEGHPDKTEKVLKQVLEIFRETVGEKHTLFAGCLNYLGHFYMEQGKYALAEEMYKKSIDIVTEMPDEESLLATAYHNISAPLRLQGRNLEAMQYLMLSKQLYDQKVGTDDYHYTAVLNSLGLTNHSMGNYDKAAEYYLEVLKITEERFGKDHKEYAVAAGNLAVCLEAKGDTEQAKKYAKASYESSLTINGSEHRFTKKAKQYYEQLNSK